MLLGATAGFLIGSAAEVDDLERVETTLHGLPGRVPPGSIAVIADVYETTPSVIDGALSAFGAVERMSRHQVETEIADLEARAEAAQTTPDGSDHGHAGGHPPTPRPSGG